MVSYIPLVAAKNAAIRPTPMHGAFSTDAYSNGCATNAVANSFVPFLRTTAIQSWPGARSNALELIEYLSGGARTSAPIVHTSSALQERAVSLLSEPCENAPSQPSSSRRHPLLAQAGRSQSWRICRSAH